MGKFKKEERELMVDLSTKTSASFYLGFGLVTSLVPIWVYHSIHHLAVTDNVPVYAAVTLISAFLLNLAYANTANQVKNK